MHLALTRVCPHLEGVGMESADGIWLPDYLENEWMVVIQGCQDRLMPRRLQGP